MRKIYYGLFIGLAIVTLMQTCINSVFGDMCVNQIITEQLSHDKKYIIVVFVRDCGATTGYSTNVSILKSENILSKDKTGNVLMLDDHYYGGYSNIYGGADAKIKWITNRKVEVSFDYKAKSRIKKTNVSGIDITYKEIR